MLRDGLQTPRGRSQLWAGPTDFAGRCHVKIVPGAKIVPAYVISCLHLDNLPGNRRRDRLLPGRLQKNFRLMFPKDEITIVQRLSPQIKGNCALFERNMKLLP